MAKIDVLTRNVENTEEISMFGYLQHLFLIYADSNGKKQGEQRRWNLDRIDFTLEDTEPDSIGDAYEYVIGKFACGNKKKKANFMRLNKYQKYWQPMNHLKTIRRK